MNVKLLNTHHFGSVDKLPSNSVYIGRPSEFGNSYSSNKGLLTKEECVALHRVDLYDRLITNPNYFDFIKVTLLGKDLACWCISDKKQIACHGINYLHILKDQNLNRTYNRTILYYLIDDLKTVIRDLEKKITYDVAQEEYLFLYLRLGDVKIEINTALSYLKKCNETQERFTNEILTFLSILVIDLEYAFLDEDIKMMDYRLQHAIWVIERFLKKRDDRRFEPMPPNLKIKKSS